MVRERDREQKEKMKKYADKRRHTAAMRIKVGDTVLWKQEKKNSLTPLFDPVSMVVIGIKGDMEWLLLRTTRELGPGTTQIGSY